MKKNLAAVLMAGIFVCLVGCGSSGSTSTETRESETEAVVSDDDVIETGEVIAAEEPQETKSSKISKDSIKAGEIDWKVEDAIIDGYHRSVFSYVNNSSFTIAELDVVFTQREDLTDEEKTVFDDFIAENSAWNESDIDGMYASVYLTEIVAPGEESREKELMLNSSWYYLPDISQYEIMEPSMMTIYFITDNDTIYTTYYDFKTDTYGESSSGETPAHEWSDSEVASMLPVPEAPVVTVSYENDHYFSFDTLGMSLSDYSNYAEECKAAGFTDISVEDDDFLSAYNEAGDHLILNYYDSDQDMSGQLTLAEDDNASDVNE